MLVIVDRPGYYSVEKDLRKTNSLSQDYSNLDDLLSLICKNYKRKSGNTRHIPHTIQFTHNSQLHFKLRSNERTNDLMSREK